MEKIIFNNIELHHQILKDGYIIVKNMIDTSTVNDLIKVYKNNSEITINENAISTYQQQNLITRKIINKAIQDAIKTKCNILFNNYKPLTGIFVSKPPRSKNSKIILHFDSNCIEEINGDESVVIWLALTDTNKENGGLQLFKGSHEIISKVRPFEKPFCYQKFYSFFEKYYLKPEYINAGDAILFLNRTMHMSDRNYSNYERIACRIDMIPAQLNAVQLYGDKDILPNQYKVYYIPDNYYEEFVRDVRPNKNIPYAIKTDNFKELSSNDLSHKLMDLGYPKINFNKKLFINRLKNIFN